MLRIVLALVSLGFAPFLPNAVYGKELRDKPGVESKTRPRSPAALGTLPLAFIENRGQVDPRAPFYVRGRDKILYFTSAGVTFVLTTPPQARASAPQPTNGVEARPLRWVLKLDFIGANPAAVPTGEQPTAAVTSYFTGPQEQWRVGLKSYAKLAYRELWPGIDLLYSGTAGRLKYQFLVRPGADPKRIRLAYRGAESLSVNEAQQLEVATPVGGFHDERPSAYQESGATRAEVAVAYEIDDAGGAERRGYGFRIGAYDRAKPLVLDPAILVYAGFIGGALNDRGNGVAVDGAGNAYVTGETSSTETTFPDAAGPDRSFNGTVDAFVAKVKADGTGLVYAGFIGGIGDDKGKAIALEPGCPMDCAAYITGETASDQTTFPVTAGPDLTHNGGVDAFVAKVNSSGTGLVYAGYIGGLGTDKGSGIAVDGAARAYVAGETDSAGTSFPDGNGFGALTTFDGIQNGGVDAFVARVAADGLSLEYAGYIGGAGTDKGSGIAVDGSSNAYVTGETDSDQTTFPESVGPDLSYNGGVDAFIAKVKNDGTGLLLTGYIGGSGDDRGRAVAVDTLGNAYVTGETDSTEITLPAKFPVKIGPDNTHNGGIDAFVAKICASVCADLSLTKTAAPGVVQVGQNITYTITVTNNGPDGAANVTITDVLPAGVTYVSATPSAGSCSGVSTVACNLGTLSNGTSGTATIVVTATAVGTVANTATVEADETDPDPSDNEATVATKATLPDLVVSGLTAPSNVAPGAAFLIQDKTANKTAVSTGGTTTKFYLSSDKILGGDTFLGSRAVPALAGNQSSSGSTPVAIPGGVPIGKYFLIAVADANGDEAEVNENDNNRVRSIAVTLPDLTVSRLAVGSKLAAGAVVAIGDTTKNQGAVSAGASTTKFFLSTDAIPDGLDTLLGSRAVPALAAKGASVGSTPVTIPAATPPGSYFIIGVSDADAGVAETREDNNNRSKKIVVTP